MSLFQRLVGFVVLSLLPLPERKMKLSLCFYGALLSSQYLSISKNMNTVFRYPSPEEWLFNSYYSYLDAYSLLQLNSGYISIIIFLINVSIPFSCIYMVI